MHSQPENLTTQQSLDIITQMIQEAKGNVQRNNFFYLFWGWIIVLANLGMYTLTQMGYDKPYLIWSITIPAWIFTLYKVFTKRNSASPTTHFNRVSGWLWLSFGISIFILVAFGFRINYQLNPVILTVAAIPTFASGTILKFNPLKFGAIAFWIFGVIAFLVSMEMQSLVGAAAVICGYLIPGYMIKSNVSKV